jgi:FkbM family methyltransferase
MGRYELNLPIQALGIGRELSIRGFRELNQLYIIRSILKGGDTILDIGSNIGFYPLECAALLGGDCTVYSYEPDKRSHAYLSDNIRRNGLCNRFFAYPEAISDTTGTAELYGLQHWNLSSLQVSKDTGSHRIVEYTSAVDVISLPEAIGRIGRAPDLLRMDVEGHEENILSSLSTMCDSARELSPISIVFEGHAWEYRDITAIEASLENMFAAGYFCTYIAVRGHSLCPMTSLGYTPTETIRWLSNKEVIFGPISCEDALRVIPRESEMATVCLQRPRQYH